MCAYICEDCGSTSVRECGSVFEYWELDEDGSYRKDDTDFGDDWLFECQKCNGEVIEFCETALTKEELKKLFSFEGKVKVVYILYLKFRDGGVLKEHRKKDLMEFIEEFKEEIGENQLRVYKEKIFCEVL